MNQIIKQVNLPFYFLLNCMMSIVKYCFDQSSNKINENVKKKTPQESEFFCGKGDLFSAEIPVHREECDSKVVLIFRERWRNDFILFVD